MALRQDVHHLLIAEEGAGRDLDHLWDQWLAKTELATVQLAGQALLLKRVMVVGAVNVLVAFGLMCAATAVRVPWLLMPGTAPTMGCRGGQGVLYTAAIRFGYTWAQSCMVWRQMGAGPCLGVLSRWHWYCLSRQALNVGCCWLWADDPTALVMPSCFTALPSLSTYVVPH